MTEQSAEKVADIVIGLALASAVYYVLRDPRLRRSAGQLARRALVSSGPWLFTELRHAWAQTGAERRPDPQPGSAARGV
jgi:hypothetical protein